MRTRTTLDVAAFLLGTLLSLTALQVRAAAIPGLLGRADLAAGDVDLSTIEWETNDDQPFIGDPNAPKGGTFRSWLAAYPLTFRLVGPDSNDGFAAWNRSQTTDFTLVRMHPTTDEYIPCLATHWKVMDDQRTIYYQLDPDARWSDGKPITAEDFVFALEMLSSEYIIDPFWNTYVDETYESVRALGPHTLEVVGKNPSWRPLYDLNLFPLPKHVHELNDEWIRKNNLEPAVGVGPYVISETVNGQKVVFSKIEDWWGADKRYFQGLYNVDRIELMVISDPDRAFDFFQKGEIDFYLVGSAKKWATGLDVRVLENGWAKKKRIFVEYPQGMQGIAFNLTKPIFQNKDFRKAVQYAFDFHGLNHNLMYDAYYRKVSAFEGTEYENTDLAPYGFDPKKCREHLAAAGYTTRGSDGIFVDESGRRASFTLVYGSRAWSAFFTVMKQTWEKLGIDVELSLLEPGTAFQRGLEREYEALLMSRATGYYPAPHQYFHSDFLSSTNNNNIWAFGSAVTDSLIDVYRYDMSKEHRLDAMHRLDAIIQDEAFYLPLFQAPYIRLAYFDYVGFPEFYVPKRFQQIEEWQVFWVDEERRAEVRAAMDRGEAWPVDEAVDADPYGVKDAVERAMVEGER